jgi:FMN phosphatase YigB (HAD superfamily)
VISRALRVIRRWRDAQEVRGSGYWDPQWYLRHNPDVAASGRDPFRHYIVYGSREGRSPGPKFDAFGYRLLNPSSSRHPLVHFLQRQRRSRRQLSPLATFESGHPVLTSGWFDADWYRSKRERFIAADVHPFVDYVQFGEHAGIPPNRLLDLSTLPNSDPVLEGYTCRLDWVIRTGQVQHRYLSVLSKGGGQAGGRPVIAPLVGRPLDSNLKIVVYVHAFYVDVLPETLKVLSNLKTDFTLVVAISEHSRVRSVNRLIDDMLGSRVRRVVHVTENRGRNFGPFVTDMAPVILQHDVVLHLHTKKSMYSGRERDEWRQHLYENLAGSTPLADTIVGLFSDDPSIGLVSPSTHESLPHWVHHWLSNVPLGRELYSCLGLDSNLVGGPVDYPVGGMFWARVEAIRPLLEAGFTLDEFPAEPAPNDGTLAHAIERCLFDLARSRGYAFVELDIETPQWRLNWSARLPLPALEELESGITEAVGSARLITVDLFDTLVLRRSVDPSSLQKFAAERVAGDTGMSPSELLQIRLVAESSARGRRSGDVDMDDIVNAADVQYRTAVRVLLDAEISLEFEMCTPRTWLVETLWCCKQNDQVMVLMSDTYLPRWCIDRLLRLIGAEDLFDDVLVSSQVRARKDSGTMWDLVESEYGVPKSQWVHIGDNEFSDVQVPVDRGIGVVHVPSPASAAGARFSLREVDSCRRLATDLVIGFASAELFDRGELQNRSSAYRFGWSGLGPLLWTYLTWVINHSVTSGSQHLLFVARDGYLPMRGLERMRPFLPETVPPSAYLLTSRRSALSIAQAQGLRLDLVLSGSEWFGTLRDLLRVRVGIEAGVDPLLDEVLELPDDIDEALRRLERYGETLVRRGKRDLASYRHYLRHLGIGDEDTCAIVDLGYSGTIQKCFETVLSNEFVGLYAATTPRARECVGEVHGLFGEDVEWPKVNNVILDNGLLLESLWQADHGQVDRIGNDESGLFAQLRWRDATRDIERLQLDEAPMGAVDFCRDVIDRFGPGLIMEQVDAGAGSMPFAYLVSGQVRWANSVLTQLRIDDDFTGNGLARVRNAPA